MTNDETLVIDYIEDGLTASSEKRCGNAESNRGGCLYTQTSSDGWSLKHPLLGTRPRNVTQARIPLLLINAMPVCLLAVSACMAKRLPEVVNGGDEQRFPSLTTWLAVGVECAIMVRQWNQEGVDVWRE